MPKYIEAYYTLSEDEMQELLTKAKNGSQKANQELLDTFKNFLNKYVTLLYWCRYDLSDYDIRRFVALYIKDGLIKYYLVRNKLDQHGAYEVHENMRGIQYMVQRYNTEEDVEQTVKMAFLQCVQRYEQKVTAPRGLVPFKSFLYSYYFYILKKQVDAFLIDQLGRKTFPLILDEDRVGEDEDESRSPGFVAPPGPGIDELLSAEDIDEFWVVGDTASAPFSYLTTQERQLLKWRYVDTITTTEGTLRPVRSSDIAHKITEHPNTLREHLHKIRSKLRELIDEELGDEAGLY